MFTEILAVILFLVLLNASPQQDVPLQALPMGLSYFALIILIRFQKKSFLLAYFELLLFFAAAIFLFGWDQISPYYSVKALLATALFLFALKDNFLLIPLFFPFLVVSVIIDLNLSLIATAIAAAALVLCFPPLLVFCWRCKPIPDTQLRERLEGVAAKAKFSHAGFKLWPLPSSTAAIIGIIPKFRYILLTNHLISRLTPEALEAVIVHEIGHSQNHHLLWGPFILSGCLIPLLAVDSATGYFFYAIFALLYFRFVFGFYSRLFEREADLHGLKIGIPLRSMKDALYQIGTKASFRIPSWHHYSLYERIDFLNAVEQDPALEKEHRRRVNFWKWMYFL